MAAFKLALPPQSTVGFEGILNMFPALSDFHHMPSIIGATVIGFVIAAPSTVTYFKATKLAGSEQFLTIAAALPVFTFIFEYLASFYGLLSITSITHTDLIAGAIITGAAIFNVFVKFHSDKLKAQKKAEDIPEDFLKDPNKHEDFNMIAESVEFCDGDTVKASKMLELPIKELEDIYTNAGDKGLDTKNISQYKTVMRNYRRKVAMADKLTGLASVKALKPAIKGAMVDFTEFTIIFIDLDKFKPINDEHGHLAWDHVLKIVAKRLTEAVPAESLVTRYGGDEFVVLLRYFNKKRAQDVIRAIQDFLEDPITLPESGAEVFIGASLGLSGSDDIKGSNKDIDADGLIKLADSEMYKVKHER